MFKPFDLAQVISFLNGAKFLHSKTAFFICHPEFPVIVCSVEENLQIRAQTMDDAVQEITLRRSNQAKVEIEAVKGVEP